MHVYTSILASPIAKLMFIDQMLEKNGIKQAQKDTDNLPKSFQWVEIYAPAATGPNPVMGDNRKGFVVSNDFSLSFNNHSSRQIL